MSGEPRQTLVHRALWRPLLVLGCEREPLFALFFFSVAVPLACVNWISVALCVPPWFVLFPLLRRMAKGDPQGFKVFRRHRAYKGYYPASTSAYSGPGWSDTVFRAAMLAPLLLAALWIAYRALT